MKKIYTALVCALLVTACTQQQAYQAVQENRLMECQKRVGDQQEECREGHSMSYEEYQREREALRKEK